MSECSYHENVINDYMCEVKKSYLLADRIAWITFVCPELAYRVRPGNCVMVFPSRGLDPLLGRPFAVADADVLKGEISVCYMILGKGTEMMSMLEVGSQVSVRGLFGVPFPEKQAKIYLAAGGAGIAIFMLFSRLFPEMIAGIYLGVPGKGYEKYVAHVLSLVPKTRVFADDGSFGEGDSMFEVLPVTFSDNEEIWACGPPGFIKALDKHYAEQPDKLYLSLDNRMACGYGGCMGCVIETKNGIKRLCVDQSLFRADEVIDDGN